MRLRFTFEALRHLETIYAFLLERNPAAAAQTAGRLRAAAKLLCDFPFLGRTGIVVGTREWVVHGTPYIIVHEVDDERDEILILAVFHGAQDRAAEE